jgi:hypothetical protein
MSSSTPQASAFLLPETRHPLDMFPDVVFVVRRCRSSWFVHALIFDQFGHAINSFVGATPYSTTVDDRIQVAGFVLVSDVYKVLASRVPGVDKELITATEALVSS